MTFLRDSSLIRKGVRSLFWIILTVCLCGCTGNAVRPEEGFHAASLSENAEADRPENDMIHGDDSVSSDNGPAEPSPVASKPSKEDTISIVMVGDILLHDGINKTCRLEDGDYDYSGLFKNVRNEIRESDIAIVNQEVIIGGKELGVTGYPSFNAPFEIADELASTGFDVVCHATNHVYDRRETGLVNCVTYWGENHPDVTIVGISDSQREKEIAVVERTGVRIAILNYTYGTNGVNISGGDRYSVNRLKKDEVISDLERAEKEADFTIVCPHWGIEYDYEPSDEQREWTDIFMDNGADLVIGTHPHVIQPVEWMDDGVNGNRMLVYYSIGNFVNWTSGKGENVGNRLVGGMARVRVGRDEDGRVTIKDNDVEALVTHLSKSRDELAVYRLKDYDDRLAGSNEILKQDSLFSVERCRDLCDNIWPGIWK